MRRREFITLVGGAVAWPLATHAQPKKMPTIGFLGTATPSTWSNFVAAFVQRLRDLGWVEGRNIAILFAGRKAALSVTPRSRPSLCSLRSTSLSHREARSSRQSRRHP